MLTIYVILIILSVLLFLIGFGIGIIQKKNNYCLENYSKVINIHELSDDYREEMTQEMKIIESQKNEVNDFNNPVIVKSTLLEERLELYEDEEIL